MDVLAYSIRRKVRSLKQLVAQRSEAEQRGEKNRASELGRQLDLEIQSLVKKIKLLRKRNKFQKKRRRDD